MTSISNIFYAYAEAPIGLARLIRTSPLRTIRAVLPFLTASFALRVPSENARRLHSLPSSHRRPIRYSRIMNV